MKTDLPDLKSQLMNGFITQYRYGRMGDCMTIQLTIVFTSGTTGRPKGVDVKRIEILLANAADCWTCSTGRLASDRLCYHFLPLSHTFERTTGYYAPMLHGAEIAYTRSIDELAEDLQIMQPTISNFCSDVFMKECICKNRTEQVEQEI